MEKNKTSEKIYMAIKESYKPRKKKKPIKEEAGAPDIVYVLCGGRFDVWKSRKDAMDFYETCIYGCEGSERERYTNIYFDLKGGATLAVDDPYDTRVWQDEICWLALDPATGWSKNYGTTKLDSGKSTKAEDVVKQILSRKIYPPKEFLEIIKESNSPISVYSPGKNKSGKFGTDKTLSKDQYEALDYYLDWAKLYDSGFYLQQDKEGNDYFIDAEAGGEKLSLEDGLYIVYESLGDPTDLPDDVLEGLQSLFKQYLNIDFFDDFGIKIKKKKNKKKKANK